VDESRRVAALILELEALLAASHSQRIALRQLLAVLVDRLEPPEHGQHRR
jgi:hypothetical protein